MEHAKKVNRIATCLPRLVTMVKTSLLPLGASLVHVNPRSLHIQHQYLLELLFGPQLVRVTTLLLATCDWETINHRPKITHQKQRRQITHN